MEKQPAPIYDADAPQRVELTIKRTGKDNKVNKHRVAHVFAPMTDDQFFNYEAKKNVVQKVTGTNILNVRTENKNLQAAEWLWNELATEREGYVQREDWKEKTDLFDKQKAIEDGLLVVFVADENESEVFADNTLDAEALSDDSDDENFSEELVDDDLQTVVRLDCLFNNFALTTTHYFHSPSAKDTQEYESAMKKATNMMDGRRGFRQKKKNQQVAQISIPSKARELCSLYDRLIINSEGYKGRVPAHHKREAVLELFGRETEVNEGK